MRKLIMLISTLVFVLLSACSDQTLVEGHSSKTPLLQLRSTASGDELQQDYINLFNAIYNEMREWDEDLLDALNNGDESALAEMQEVLLQIPGMEQLAYIFHAQLEDLIDTFGEAEAGNVLAEAVDEYMREFIMGDDDPALYAVDNECFDALQHAQWQAFTAYVGCAISTSETVIGPFICFGVFAGATIANLKNFYACIDAK